MGMGFGFGFGNGMASQGSNVNQNLESDINLLSAEHALSPLTIPDPTGANSNTHAYVIDFLQEYNIAAWNGYRYWMGFTPLVVAADENPCVAASNDATTWVVPDGLINPIEPAPGVNTYNADSFLFYDKLTGILHYYFRQSNVHICEKHSTDGINWSATVIIFTFATTGEIAGADNYTSPSIVKKGNDLYAFCSNKGSKKILSYKFNNPTGVWGDPTDCVFETSTLMDQLMIICTDAYKWHQEVRYFKGYFYLIQMFRSADQRMNQLWLAKGTDGVHFKFAKYPVISKYYDINTVTTGGDFAWDMNYYKASFIPYEVDKKLMFKLWYTGASKLNSDIMHLGYSTIEERAVGLTITDSGTQIADSRLSEITKANALTEGYVFCDDFNRADGAIGVSSCGKSYTLFRTGSAWKIANQCLVNSGTGFSGIKIDNMPVNYDMIVQMYNVGIAESSSTIDSGIIAKFVSWSTTVPVWATIWEGSFGSKLLYIQGGGTYIRSSSCLRNFIKEDLTEFRLIFNGTNLKYYINGILQFEHIFVLSDFKDQTTMDSILASTSIGFMFFTGETLNRVKNITIKAL